MSTTAQRLSNTVGDRYRIERELGAGGMATVYLAEDVKHRRRVALKVLHPELSSVLGPERFLQEIQLTASLQHPHILPLFDSGEADGLLFYVMPYIDGETLRSRLERERHLPIADAVRLASEVADALEYAHRRGLVHRDIKPENILLHEGRPLLADFGIALAVQHAGGQRMTQTGLSLGTPQYMAPEQAMGEPNVDARADIYALGVVLYEMLAGEPPFTAPTAQGIVARVVTERPGSLIARRDRVPPNVEQTVMTALEKLPADRFSTAASFRAALMGDAVVPRVQVRRAPMTGAWRKPVPVALAAIALLLVAVTTWALTRPRQGPAEYDVGLADSARVPLVFSPNFAVSPHADFMVYAARTGSSLWGLWRRSLTDGSTVRLTGAGGWSMRLSPDGRYGAYITPEAPYRTQLIPINGGAARTLGASDGFPVWTSNTRLLVIVGDGVAVHTYDVDAGLISSRPISHCILPHWVPRLEKLLCGGGATPFATLVDPVDGSEARLVPTAGGAATTGVRGAHFRLIDDRYLVFVSISGDLRAARFDPATLRVGPAITMVAGLRRENYTGAGQYDIAGNGTLVYVPGANAEVGRFVTVGEDGVPQPLALESDAFLRFDLAPDGRRLAVATQGTLEQELRIYDVVDGRRQVWLTAADVGQPLWLPDGERIIVTVQDVAGGSATIVGSPTAAGAPDTILTGVRFVPASFERPTVVVGWQLSRGTEPTVPVRLDLGQHPARLDTLAREGAFAALSPDGRWLVSEEASPWRMTLTSYPVANRRFEVTTEGGDAQWLSDRELVYWSNASGVATWYRVRIDPGSNNPVGRPRGWFADPRFADTPGRSHQVTPDGRLLYVQGPEQTSAAWVRVVPGWVEAMKRAVDAAPARTR